MRKYKDAIISVAQRSIVYAEGKNAFTIGKPRGHNPYTASNLALSTIWWNGWDTGEEESSVVSPAKKKA